jgi:hypothetical protein
MVMMMYSLILRDWEKGGEVGVDPTGCLRLLCPRPYQVRELMPLTGSTPISKTQGIYLGTRRNSDCILVKHENS